jgi:hypothetical protein
MNENIKNIIVSIISIIIVYVAFVKDILLFEIFLYLSVTVAYLGLLLPSTINRFLTYRWWELLLMWPTT